MFWIVHISVEVTSIQLFGGSLTDEFPQNSSIVDVEARFLSVSGQMNIEIKHLFGENWRKPSMFMHFLSEKTMLFLLVLNFGKERMFQHNYEW